MTSKIRIGVLGASGYTGADLVRLALLHPNMEIAALTANSHAGKPMAEVFPHFSFVELPQAHHHRGGRLVARSTPSSAACRTARRRRSPRPSSPSTPD